LVPYKHARRLELLSHPKARQESAKINEVLNGFASSVKDQLVNAI
jgi:hypothetical protein